jgi:hypothetical protein
MNENAALDLPRLQPPRCLLPPHTHGTGGKPGGRRAEGTKGRQGYAQPTQSPRSAPCGRLGLFLASWPLRLSTLLRVPPPPPRTAHRAISPGPHIHVRGRGRLGGVVCIDLIQRMQGRISARAVRNRGPSNPQLALTCRCASWCVCCTSDMLSSVPTMGLLLLLLEAWSGSRCCQTSVQTRLLPGNHLLLPPTQDTAAIQPTNGQMPCRGLGSRRGKCSSAWRELNMSVGRVWRLDQE